MTQSVQGTSVPSVFQFQNLSVRAFADQSGEPWFLANDVCIVLGYSNPRQAVQKNCRERGVSKRDTPTESGVQWMTYINEGNLYRLITKSRKPEAEAFEIKVMDEILPSIRKTGSYSAPSLDIRTTLTETGSTPTLPLPADIQQHLNQKAIALALEAHDLLTEYLKRQVAANCEYGMPRMLDQDQARAVIDNCELGAALAGRHMASLDNVRHWAQAHLHFTQELLAALPAKRSLS